MRLTHRLILPSLLVLGLATCKGDGDGEPVDDSTITDDSSTDTDPQPPEEDCFTEGDEEQDGLADCEDDDCLDGCLEDCGDTVDNDADGVTDCDDDECVGAEGCTALYSMTAKITPDEITLLWGPGLVYELGESVAGLIAGKVKIYGTPIDPSDPSFSCSGLLYGYPSAAKAGYGALEYIGGDCDGCDFRFEMTTTVENGGLVWPTDCPVMELPVAKLGFFMDRYEVTRYDPNTATWAPQYSSARGSQYTRDYGNGAIYVSTMDTNTQLNRVVWEESL